MKFTEKQIEMMWKVFCATQGVPRLLAGLPPRERQSQVRKIKGQQAGMRKSASMLDDAEGPDEVRVGGRRYRRVDAPGSFASPDYSKFAEGPSAGIVKAADQFNQLVDEAKELMSEAAEDTADRLQRKALGDKTHLGHPDTYHYSSTTVTVPVDTGETDGNEHSVSEDGPSTGSGGGGSSEESGETKAAYDW